MFSVTDAELITVGHREQMLHGLIWLVIWNQAIETNDGRMRALERQKKIPCVRCDGKMSSWLLAWWLFECWQLIGRIIWGVRLKRFLVPWLKVSGFLNGVRCIRGQASTQLNGGSYCYGRKFPLLVYPHGSISYDARSLSEGERLCKDRITIWAWWFHWILDDGELSRWNTS